MLGPWHWKVYFGQPRCPTWVREWVSLLHRGYWGPRVVGAPHLVAVTSGDPHAGFDLARRESYHFLLPSIDGSQLCAPSNCLELEVMGVDGEPPFFTRRWKGPMEASVLAWWLQWAVRALLNKKSPLRARPDILCHSGDAVSFQMP